MALNHLSLGTEGLAPSIFKHFRVASLGYDFEIEVIVVPVDPHAQSGGGAGFGLPDYNNYVVTVRVRYKKRIWETSKPLDNTGLARLEKVMASFAYARRVMDKTRVYAELTYAKILKLISINITKR